MSTFLSPLRADGIRLCDSLFQVRYISLNTAINRGIRKDSAFWEGRGNVRSRLLRRSLEAEQKQKKEDKQQEEEYRYSKDPTQRRMRNDLVRWKPRVNEWGEDESAWRGSPKSGGKSINKRRKDDGKEAEKEETGEKDQTQDGSSRTTLEGQQTVKPEQEEPESPWAAALKKKGPRRKWEWPHVQTVKPPKYQSSNPYWDYKKNAQYEPLDGLVRHKIGLVGPKTVPRTHAASEFIYGTSAVQAAIKCRRRKLYALYVYDEGVNKSMMETRWQDPLMKQLQKFALMAGAKVKLVKGTWIDTLDKMSEGRPHNGVVLEASPLPKLPAVSYARVESPSSSHFTVNLAPQPPEEAEINGTDGRIERAAHKSGSLAASTPTTTSETSETTSDNKPQRYPFTLLLDGILDPGNLGGIIRSAHFLGVDAIAFSTKNSAPLTPVTMKASAGAAESIPLIAVQDTKSFIEKSKENGWRFFAAEAPGSASSKDRQQAAKKLNGRDKNKTLGDGNGESISDDRPFLITSELSPQLYQSPCVLMLGGEGEGLSKKLSNAADAFVAVPGVYSGNLSGDSAGVDSLNVSVASALLCEAFLRETGNNVNLLKRRLEAEIHAAPELDDEEDDNRLF
ncbi:hypothetical protein VTO42DRAFT_2849 [Malbranchea cinnamomea]